MSDLTIKAEGIFKQYRIGGVGSGSLVEDLNRFWHTLRGKEDPYINLGEKNTRDRAINSKYALALKDISFEIRKGESVAIIGKNGAGKSTLLKIISNITTPTKGCIKIKGKISSLLEVGTGFHQDLTGRENIFLNGAILGLKRHEIIKKFDEIVGFAGVEAYIDTPVKRYSSGMIVRLGFAIGSFLENDTLIIDEVLAVGDYEFQKKCISKIESLVKSGDRSIIVVSHNFQTINQICQRGILLKDGENKFDGRLGDAIASYYSEVKKNADTALRDRKDRSGSGEGFYSGFSTCNTSDSIRETFESGETIVFKISLEKHVAILKEVRVAFTINSMIHGQITVIQKMISAWSEDKLNLTCTLKNPLIPGDYSGNLFLASDGVILDWLIDSFSFVIVPPKVFRGEIFPIEQGAVFFDYNWESTQPTL